MNKGNVVHGHDGVLFGHEEGQNHGICRKMDATGNHYVKKISPSTSRALWPVWWRWWDVVASSEWPILGISGHLKRALDPKCDCKISQTQKNIFLLHVKWRFK
jgi:hypothetical protein